MLPHLLIVGAYQDLGCTSSDEPIVERIPFLKAISNITKLKPAAGPIFRRPHIIA
jgi:hypothetical protein